MNKIPGVVPDRDIIFVVDDDSAVRDSLKFSLEIEGFEVRTYASGDEFLTLDNLPESGCLVVNYHMPAMNGLELVSRLRDRHISVPIILMTGYSGDNLLTRAAVASVSLIEKPFLRNGLVEHIRRALTAHKAQSGAIAHPD